MLLMTHFGLVVPCVAQGTAGALRGVVYDAEFDGPVPNATVAVIELNVQTNTLEDGHFILGALPAGTYTVTVSKPGFERYVQPGVAVAAGALAELTVRLKGEFTEMEEMVVRDMELTDTSSESGLLNLRATTLSSQDSISADAMRRAGAGDAASALRLVVGASVAEGKYATVRGLSDRYVGTALNGIRIPSSDPRKRAVHLDVFPAGTIESMTVSKTFTPDLPGDYSGGGVNIRTIGIPKEPFVKVSSTRELNRDYSGKPGYVTYDGGGTGPWGRHMGARDMPKGADAMEGLLQEDSFQPVDDAAIKEIDRITFAMDPAMGTKETIVPDGNFGVSLSGGDRADFGDGYVGGWTAAFTYGKKYSLQSGSQVDMYVPRWPTNEPAAVEVFDKNIWTNNVGTEEVKWSMLGSLGLAHDDNDDVSLTFLRNRAATDRAGLRIGEAELYDPPYFEQRQAIHYAERSLDVMQLRGSHKNDEWLGDLCGLRLDWFGAHNVAQQEEPDIRYFRNFVVNFPEFYNYTFVSPAPGTQGSIDKAVRIWRNTKEDNSQVGLNLEFPFERPRPDHILSMVNAAPQQEPWAQTKGSIKTGFTRDWTQRIYRQYTFWYEGLQPTFTNASPNKLWTDTFTDPELIGSENTGRVIKPRTGAGPGEPWEGDTHYDGIQNFHSGYLMIDYPMTARLHLSAGARLEGTELQIDPAADRVKDPARAFAVPVKNPDNGSWTIRPVAEEEATVNLHEADWLRSVNAVYDVTKEMKLRATWSQTIARPTLLELAPVINTDYVADDNLVGNADLKLSHVVNEDLRWEWFPKPGEVFSASVFHKKIQDPIDREAFVFLSQEYLIAVNLPEGTVRGWEVEARKQLDFLPDVFQFFSLGANYTFIDARVKVPLTYLDNYAADDVMLSTVGARPGPTNTIHRLGQSTRDMEGQPDHLWNINVTWDYKPWGTSAGLFYSVRGDMLRSGVSLTDEGRIAIPNTYITEVASVNFSLSQEFADGWKATFQAKNLLDPPIDEVYRFPDGKSVIRRRYHDGVSYSLQMGASW